MDTFVLVTDRVGCVGVYETLEAAQCDLQKYAELPLVVTSHPRSDPRSKTVWTLPYRGSAAVAYASDDRDEILRAQKILLKLDLVYDDDIKHWECEIGEITAPALRRFEAVTQSLDVVAMQEQADALLRGGETDPTALPTEKSSTARINLLESVIPRELFPEAF